MHTPSIAIIENDKMAFYRYTDASKSTVEMAITSKNAPLVNSLFETLDWSPIAVSGLTQQARDALNLIP